MGEFFSDWMADPRPRWQRLFGRLFPIQSLPTPARAEGVTSITVVHLDVLDRLRVLVSGKLEVQVQTDLDKEVICGESRAAASVLPPWWPR